MSYVESAMAQLIMLLFLPPTPRVLESLPRVHFSTWRHNAERRIYMAY